MKNNMSLLRRRRQGLDSGGGRWRQAALVLNASRRFQYTLDLKKEEENKQNSMKMETHVQDTQGSYHFKVTGEKPDETLTEPPSPSGDYDVSPEQLAAMIRDRDFEALHNFGGVEGLAEKLKTNLDKGIHEDESNILDRKSVFGSNTFPQKRGESFWRFLLDACRDTTLYILMVAAAASLALGIKTKGIQEGWYDGVAIALVVIFVVAVRAISDYVQLREFQNLDKKQNVQLQAVRGGRRVQISVFDIVVGDVILLTIGNQVPADGVLVSGHSLAIDESSMAGESEFVNKDHISPFLMSGCKVADGNGTMLVTGVGINTEWGLLVGSISEHNREETPLQVRLNGVVTLIGIVGLVNAVSVLVILLARFYAGHTEDPEGKVQFIAGKTSVRDAVNGTIKDFLVAASIVVVAVPAVLPLAVTLTLAYSTRKMMSDKALVRRLYACETMGSATTICSNKTGILTMNQMTVLEAYICGKKIDPPNNTSELPSGIVSLLTEGVAQNTTGSVFLSASKDVEVSGSPTEKAILHWGLKIGMDFEVVRSESSIIHAFPFDSEKKRGGVAVKRQSDSQVHVHWKGAAEIVLAACTRYMDSNEQSVPLDEGKVEYFEKAIEDMAAGSLRCVAIAYRPLKGETVPIDEDELTKWELPEDDLVLLAIVGLKDPCRPGVRDVVQLCVKAGVKVRMVTGDNLQTAKAIALECGILGSDADATEPNLIEGKSFRALTDAQTLEVADRISVMGRSSPNDKLLLVQALRKIGHVVAVTGDGTNDAPALNEADVGLAMGIAGTEVAKESSDIIILDDNFASVVKVVRWGRSIYANIQKIIQFQLTINIAAVIINIVVAVTSGDVPLNAVQFLWVNLIIDTLGAFAPATEQPTDHLMDRPPVGRREPLITNIMWRNLLIQAFYQVLVILVLNFRGTHLQQDTDEHAMKVNKTLIFNSFFFAQIFNEFAVRKHDKINVYQTVTQKRLHMGITCLTVVLQVVIVTFLGKFTSTTRVSLQLWLVSIVLGFISWPLALVGKLIPVSERSFGDYFIDILASLPFGSSDGHGDHESVDDPFDIARTKSAPVDRLKRWRQAALVLNASRRFRYTLDLKKEEIISKLRTHSQVIRAALLPQLAGEKSDGSPPPSAISTGAYDVSPEQLATMTREHYFAALQNFGGVKGLAEKLKTNPDKGIPEDDSNILDRKNVFGANTYPRKKGRSFWRFLLDACRDTTLIILMVAAAASLALGIKTEGIKEGWYDGGSIALAVIIVIAVTAFSDYKQSLQFQNLNEEKQNIQLEVVRGGRRVEISIFDIVVGDVIPLKIGDQVPADGVLVSGHSLAIDESSMTGESKIFTKDHKSPFLMSGCKVADGYGTMLATSVGINTEWGLLMSCISEDNGEETPLQLRLNGVATFIGIVGLVVAVSVLVVLLARFFTGHTKDADGKVQFIAGKTSLGDAVDGAIKIFTVAVTIVVVAVPEGLPLAVTLTLAYSMRKMMADKALVRRLSACETMGSATTICSDKTGTLTLNMMTVVEAYICGKKIDPPNNTSELPSGIVSLLTESVAQNTTGSVFLSEGKDVEVSGSPTEKAILQWGLKIGMNFEAVRSESSIIHAFPFNSEKKRGGVAVKRAQSDSEVHVHWKGAAEIVLAACTRYMDSNEQFVPLDEEKVEYFKKAISDMAAGSLRCVAIAYRPLKGETVPIDEDELTKWELPEDDLVLLAIVGLKDPCRPGVREAVQLCVKAGVKVRMVTGDNLQTAKAIALECGILGSDADATEPNLIEGKSFRALTDAQRLEVADRISVMGRSSPNDKLLLVQALRKKGHVVAVTGDGTNDAPALHEADIGLAMGIAGTEVAKESSDIIILDDNFASVVKVVRWGRSVYANIQKFIQFQLTVNVAALIINVVAAVSSGDVPLNAVQLLWVNLIMDTLGALALATEPPTDHLMDRPPVGRREPLITNIMWRNLLIQAFYQCSVLLVLNFGGRQILHTQHKPDEHAIKEKNTLIFNAFVFAQIFNEFNARKPDEMNVFKGVTKNRLFMGIVAFTVVLQVVIVMFLGKFTSTVRLSWQLWLVSIAIGFISWPLALVGKLIPVPERPFGDYIVNIFASCKKPRNQGSSNENNS